MKNGNYLILIGVLLFVGCLVVLVYLLTMGQPKPQTAEPETTVGQVETSLVKEPDSLVTVQTEAPSRQTVITQIEPELPDTVGSLSLVHGVDTGHLLVALPKQYTNKVELVHQEVYQPLLSLIEAAAQDGIELKVVSAYRSYDRQKQIWERKWGDSPDGDTQKAVEILKWSSFPGTSRHHWGTDIDFNSVEPNYWKTAEGSKVHQWLYNHAASFGFCQTYDHGRTSGYNEEPWHWSHIPTADRYYQQIIRPDVLQVAIDQDVRGAQAVEAALLMEYITSVNHCTY